MSYGHSNIKNFFLKHHKNEGVKTIGAECFWSYNSPLGCSGSISKMNCENYMNIAFKLIQKDNNFIIKWPGKWVWS